MRPRFLCGGDSSSTTEGPIVDFTATELQTDTQYSIEVTNAEFIGNTDDIELRALSINGEEVTSYGLGYDVRLEEKIIFINYKLSRKNSILQRNQPVLLELKLNDSNDVFQQKVFVWDMPIIEELNMPQRGALVSDKTIEAIGVRGVFIFIG